VKRLLPLFLLLSGCSSDGDKPVEMAKGPLVPMRVMFWSDATVSGDGHVAERRLADGSRMTREHLVGIDPAVADMPAFWADVSVETAPDGTVARILILAGIGVELASAPRRLDLVRSAAGRWSSIRKDGKTTELPELDGCDDAEIAGDHASISLPVRRLALKAGESKDFDRALVRLPHLDFEKVRRRLTRVDETTWTWEGLGKDGSPASRIDLRADASGTVVEMTGEGLHRKVVRDTAIE